MVPPTPDCRSASPRQIVAFSSRLLLHGNFPITRGIRHSIVYFVHSTFFHHLRDFSSIYEDLEAGIERDSRGFVFSSIPRQDLNDVRDLNNRITLSQPKKSQTKIPERSCDKRRGNIVSESKKAKKHADSYELLLELVGDLIPIQGKLGIDINPVLEAELRRDKVSSDKPIRLFDLLLCLEDDIATIQEKIGIVGYTNQEMAEEANKHARVYLRKFEKFHGPLEDDPGMLIKKFVDRGVKKFWFTGEGLPLFPNVTLQQLHEIFVKKSTSNNQCPCLESKVKQGKLSQIYIHHSK
ncbi:hypothetical protein G9A89_004537 [Geosiphon pyriformis]|nr:hypothetical protein G9A89_004537 [Geosiphon pyriformis]